MKAPRQDVLLLVRSSQITVFLCLLSLFHPSCTIQVRGGGLRESDHIQKKNIYVCGFTPNARMYTKENEYDTVLTLTLSEYIPKGIKNETNLSPLDSQCQIYSDIPSLPLKSLLRAQEKRTQPTDRIRIRRKNTRQFHESTMRGHRMMREIKKPGRYLDHSLLFVFFSEGSTRGSITQRTTPYCYHPFL